MNCKKITVESALSLLPARRVDTHKGSYGKNLLLCGSIGYTGAAWFASMGALRAGAGLVFLGVPEQIYAIEAVKLNEAVVFPLPDENGMLSCEALPNILSRMESADSVLIGCGLGRSENTKTIVKEVIRHSRSPVVVDADAISLLADDYSCIQECGSTVILTPHDGEFTRLGFPLTSDRISSAIYAAKTLGAVIILKGHESIITDGTETYINTTGNPGMAVGGSGDVLAGMLTALIGQGLPPLQAAACACCLHGAAGDMAAAKLGQYSMLPSDLLDYIPSVLHNV